jgi:transposase
MSTSAQQAAPTNSNQVGLTPVEDFLSSLVMILLVVLNHLVAENKWLGTQIVELEAALKLERAKRFGNSSERNSSPNKEVSSPLIIEGEVSEIPPAPSSEAPEPARRQHGGQPGHKGSGRSIPSDLERQETYYELSEAERCCPNCRLPYAETTLTEDSEEVEVTVKAHVRRHRRKRYRQRCKCPGPKFITAPIPPKLIPKGKFTVATWVKFLLDKYQAQIPITRQLKQLEQIGLPVAKSTVSGGFRKLYDYLLPLYEYFLNHLRTARHLHADETSWRVFEAVVGKANHRWWLWVFASHQVGVVVFVIDPSRSANVPKKHLAEKLPLGQTQAEGYEVNLIDGQAYALSNTLEIISADRLRVYQAISELFKVAFCWSHQRRDFVDFQKAYADHPILFAWADSWVEEIAQLYALNKHRLAVLDQPEAFRKAQAELEAAIAAMKNRTTARQGLTTAQEKILLSMERHWNGLTIFVHDPDIPMDNNWAERLLRTPVLGRKNYYGHQTQWAGELAAIVFSIVETCLLNALNPYQFLVSYFQTCAELGTAPSDLTPFTPWLNRDRSPP